MKVKGDFVTNSSSTAFFFIFGGEDKQNLFNLIKKYHKKFEITEDFGWNNEHDYRSINSEFVIESIDNVLSSKPKYYDEVLHIQPIEILIEDFEKCIQGFSNTDLKTLSKYYKRYIREYKKKLNILKDVKEKGLNYYLEIEFGDNHGHVSGNPACVMDYSMKEIKTKDFILLRESRH